MELATREIPATFTTSNGKFWSREGLPLDSMSRDDIKAIAKFLQGYWHAEEINKTWLGQVATKGQMIEFISTGYIKTAITEREKSASSVSVPEVQEDEPSYTSNERNGASNHDDDDSGDLAGQIAKAIQSRIKFGSVNPDQVRAIVDEKLEETLDAITGMFNNQFGHHRDEIADLQVTHAQHVEDRLKEIQALVSRVVSTRLQIDVTGRPSIEVTGLRHKAYDDLLADVSAFMACHETERANLWLVGPAGTGKTTAAKHLAGHLGVPFHFNGAIDSEYKLRGFVDAQGRIINTPFRRAYQFGGVYLFDEVDSSLPSACLAFNAALANGEYDFPCLDETQATVKRHPECIILAASNTWGGPEGGYVGRFRQDAAFMDRFMRVAWETDENLESALCANKTWSAYVQSVRAKAIAHGVEHLVSPRATFNGDVLLAAGRPWDRVVEICVRKGLEQTDWDKLNS